MLYVVRGEASVNGTPVRRRTMVELGAANDRTVELTCEGEDALVLFCHGAEIQEPVVAYGPFVMNTEDEIREAYAEYQAGKFGRV
jgi:redox-sensitive bicupin YhaK (pirin superfamily)